MLFLSPRSELWDPGRVPAYPEVTAFSNPGLLFKIPDLTAKAESQLSFIVSSYAPWFSQFQ